jgi:hypothetical protein
MLASIAALAIVMLALSTLVTSNSRPSPPAGADGLIHGTIVVDFTGAPASHPLISEPFAVEAGQSAWDALKQSLGEERMETQDFGGGLGISITAFDGVTLRGNSYWEFRINGTAADVGVSIYQVKDGDTLEFRVATF